MLKRVIVDSQSNRLFQGVPLEQNYDQRGGLCQVGEGSVIITTEPICPGYLHYWQDLGFSLPNLLVAGPFDPRFTLSELIIQNVQVQKDLKNILLDHPARLEFFCIEESERQLSRVLGIKPYCNFDVSIELARKNRFKTMFDEIGLSTPYWVPFDSNNGDVKIVSGLLEDGPVLLKSVDGTGGISCNGMVKVDSPSQLEELIPSIGQYGQEFIAEQIILNKAEELSVHWEITEGQEIKILGIFRQLSDNYAYAGTSSIRLNQAIEEKIKYQLHYLLGPELVSRNALGFYCCDLIISQSENVYWIDLNPRKGAIIYINDMIRRLSEIHFNGHIPFFFHKHAKVSKLSGKSVFDFVRERLKDLLTPKDYEPFVVLTNPGVMPFGYVDITGISTRSLSDAKSVYEQSLKRLQM